MMMRSLLWVTVMSLMACEGCERFRAGCRRSRRHHRCWRRRRCWRDGRGPADAGSGWQRDALFRRADR